MSRSLLLTCNSRSATISMHDYDHENRVVTHLGNVPLLVPSGENSASPMALSVDVSRLYLTWRGAEKRLLSFTLDPVLATLVLVGDKKISSDICYLHAADDGLSLLGAGEESMLEFPLVEQISQAAGPPLPVGAMAHCVVSDRLGRAYASACRGDLIRRFAASRVTGEFDDTPQPQGSGPRHLCLSPDNQHLYCVTQESGEVVVFSTEPGLVEIQRVNMVEGAEAPMGGDIGLTPDGRFLFATERSTNRLVCYRVDEQTGLLQPNGFAAVPDYPRALCVGDSGKFVAVAGFRGHRTAIFAIESDGGLELSAEYETGERPSAVLAVRRA